MLGVCLCWATLLGAEPAVATLPVESVTLFQNNLAWVRRTGKVPVHQGTALLAIDTAAQPGSWSVQLLGSDRQRLLSMSTDAYGPLTGSNWDDWLQTHEGEELVIGLASESVRGRLVRPAPFETGDRRVFGIATGTAIRLMATADVLRIERPRSPQARLEIAPGLEEIALETSALVVGLGWTPSYRLQIGPEGQGQLQLWANIRNATGQPISTKGLECALGAPTLPADSVNPLVSNPHTSQQTAFPLGASNLESQNDRHYLLLQNELKIERHYRWRVAGLPGAVLDAPSEDRINAFLRLPNRTDRALPAGPVVVISGSRLQAKAIIPYTAVGEIADVDLGAAVGLAIERQETELERKQAVIRRENEEYDWVRVVGALAVTNRLPESAQVQVIKEFEGEGLDASDNGVIQRSPNRVGRDQAVTKICWDLAVPAGQCKRVTYGYHLHLAPPNGK